MIPKNGILALFFINTGILAISFQTLEFWPFFYKHWNSYLIHSQIGISDPTFYTLLFDLILRNIGILALFLQTLEFLSDPSIANIEILAFSFQTREFWPIVYTHCFFISSFKTLGFWPYFYKRWNYDLMIPKNGILALFFINTGILAISFQTLEFWPFFYKHWNSYLIHSQIGISDPTFYTLLFDLILRNIGILALFLQTLEFLSDPSIANIEILAFSFQTREFWPIVYTHCFFISSFKTLGFWPYFYKRWNYDLMIPKNGILALF